MAHLIGYVDNSNGLSAHYNFFTTLRKFALGYGTVSNLSYTGTGDGQITNLEALPASITETWTVTCTVASIDGGTFSVTGSISGAKADAQVGVEYNNGIIKFTITDGATDFAVGDTFTFDTTQSDVSANGENWEELMYNDSTDDWHVMLKGKGFTGSESIYVGFRTYQSVANNYYNIATCAMTGYLPSESFYNQPQFVQSGIPLDNDRVDYWITLNAQRIAFCCKVDADTYESGYVGKFYPYCPPTQYPYPVVCAGMFGYNDSNTTPGSTYNTIERLPYYGSVFSNNNLILSYRAYNFRAYSSFAGEWFYPGTFPGSDTFSLIRNDLIDLDGNYTIIPYELWNPDLKNTGTTDTNIDITPAGIYGKLDGVYWVSGWNNVAENTFTINGDTYVIFKEKNLTVDSAFYALKLDS